MNTQLKPNTVSFVIRSNQLKAAYMCAAKKDVRYYLNGVHIRKDESMRHHGVIEATNGHYLFQGCFSDASGADSISDCPPFDIIIPNDAIKLALSSKDSALTITTSSVGSISYTPIDAKFPDFTAVIPKEFSGIAGNYNYDYLSLLSDALSAWDDRKKGVYRLEQNGPSASARMASMDAFCIVMPVRV